MATPLRIKLVLTALLAVMVISPARVELFAYEQGLQRGYPTRSLRPRTPALAADLDGNGTTESAVLANQTARLEENGRILWQSPKDWQVRQAAFTDLNRDGMAELALLVWRPFKPWLIDRMLPRGGRIDTFHDAGGQSCQLILIGWKLGAYREAWAGSPLVDPLQQFAAVDLDGDGWQELSALEGRYNDIPSTPAWSLSVWKWNGFGFSLGERQEGSFAVMQPLQSPAGTNYLLVQRH